MPIWPNSTAIAHPAPGLGAVVTNDYSGCWSDLIDYTISCLFMPTWLILVATQEKRSSGFLTRSHTNQAVQAQKMAKGLKFWI